MNDDATSLWIAEYVRVRGTREGKFHRSQIRLLQRFQLGYLSWRGGGSFLDEVDRTGFLDHWVQGPPYACWSDSRRRVFFSCLRGFTAWLFGEGRTNHDVYSYLTVSEVVQGRVEDLKLRDGLQRHILDFEKWLRAQGEWRSAWVLGAHRYNRYRSQPDSPAEETDCLLAWMQQVARASPRRAVAWVSGLARVFRRAGRPELDDLLTDCRSIAAALRALAQAEEPRIESLRKARCPRFESGLAGWLQALLEHRAALQMKAGSWPAELRRLDRIALRSNVEQPEQLTGAMLEEFLASPGARTRNMRLSRLRALARLVARRGARLELSGWLAAPEPAFRPHLYTLQEIGGLLQAMGERGQVRRAFHWLGIETIVFLLYACGMRLREPLGLRVRDIHLPERALLVYHTKFYKQRWVPLGAAAHRRLAHYLEQRRNACPGREGADDALFLNDNGRAFRNDVLHRAFSRVRQALGLRSRGTRPQPRLHDLRHSLAVHRLYQWYAEGADVQNKLPLLSAYLGHDRLQHTEVYLHLTEDLIRQAGRNFQASFEHIVGSVARFDAGPA